MAEEAALSRLWHAHVTCALRVAGVDHLLIKGATWPESLRLEAPAADIDVLVEPRQERLAVQALRDAGWDSPDAGARPAEVALHSVTLQGSGRPEVDLHRSYPGLEADRDKTWRLLFDNRTHLPLAHQTVPTLTLDGHLLIAAASAARDGAQSRGAARLANYHGDLTTVGELATALDAGGTLRAGLEHAGRTEDADRLALPPKPARWNMSTRGAARLAEISASPPRMRFQAALRELWPSAEFLGISHPGVSTRRARRDHIKSVLTELPQALREWVRSRQDRPSA